MISPVGYTPRSAAAALRAGIPAFEELGYQDQDGEPVVGAPVPEIPATVRGRGRLQALAGLLLDGVPPELGDPVPWDRMPLVLCVAEPQRPGAQPPAVLSDLHLPNGQLLGAAGVHRIERGPVAAFQAIDYARGLLEQTDTPACLVVAIDSLIDARVLAWLDGCARLKTSRQTDGVIPGEAAGMAIVSKRPMLPTGLTCRGIGLAQEPATVMNDDPFAGIGLAAALRSALGAAGVEMHDVDFRLSDVAGESYAFEELVLAQTRVMRKVRSSQPLWHPADCLGDCGAAAGLIQIAWAEQAFARGYAPGRIAALHASAAWGDRAVAIVEP